MSQMRLKMDTEGCSHLVSKTLEHSHRACVWYFVPNQKRDEHRTFFYRDWAAGARAGGKLVLISFNSRNLCRGRKRHIQ